MIKLKNLNPFGRFCCTIGNIPTSYMESLSYEEQLLWFCRFLEKEVIPAINNNNRAVMDLYNYLMTLDVQDEINNKLDQMALDGTLENIIGNIFNKTNGELTFNTVFKNTSENIVGVTNQEIPITGYVQGMCTTPNSYIVAYQTGGALHDKTNMIFLTEISKETNTVIRQAYLELFHANSLAYNHNTNEIYVATTSYFDSEYVRHDKNDIIIVDYATFTIKETVTPSADITNVNRVRSVSYDNEKNKLYLGDVKDVYEMYDFSTVKNHIVLNDSNVNEMTNNTVQNFVVCNDVIYVTRTYPNGINMFDLNGNLIKNYYDFKTDIDTFLIETESLYVEANGDVYVIGTNYSKNDNSNYRLYETVLIKSNFKTNGYLTEQYRGLADTNFNIYVDVTTTNTRQTGSQTYPFKTIQQAINFTNFLDKDIQFIINLVGENKQYSCFVTKTSRKIVLNANNNYIYAMQIENQDMVINNLKINGTNFVNFSDSYPTPVRITNNSKIVFNSLRIENNGNTIENGLYISNSQIYMLGLYCKACTNAINMENGFVDLFIKNITVSSVSNYWKTGTSTHIDYSSNANNNRVNPESAVLPINDNIQAIDKTIDGNNVLFTNVKNDTGTSPYHLFTQKITYKINNTSYPILIPYIDGINYSTRVSDTNNIYDICVKVDHPTTGKYQFTSKVYQTIKSTGAISDITSNVEITYNASYRIK